MQDRRPKICKILEHRLASQTATTNEHFTVRFGSLRQLPKVFVDERHVVIVKQLPPSAWCYERYEFEERATGRNFSAGRAAPCSSWVLQRKWRRAWAYQRITPVDFMN
jgi:hypothetical protein